MKKNQINFLLLIFFIIGMVGCKKDNYYNVENDESNVGVVAAARNWHKVEATKIIEENKMGSYPLGASMINWKKGIAYKNKNTILIYTDLKSDYFKKYLKVTLSENGRISNESYLYIYFAKKEEVYKNNQEIEKEFLKNEENKLLFFEGTILEYDLSNKLIQSKDYEDGVKNLSTKRNFETKRKDEENFTARGNIISSIGGVCIDWYWNTYFNGTLINSMYVTTTCSGGTCTGPCDNPNDEGGGGTSGGDIDPDDNLESLADICEKSFLFSIFNDRPGGWQVAGTSNIHMNIVNLETGDLVPIYLPTMFFGLPVTRFNGDYYSPEDAKAFAAAAVNYAETETIEYYHNSYIPGNIFSLINIQLKYREKMNYYMQTYYSGSATLSPGSNIIISNIKTAKYSWPWLGCL